MIFTVFPHDPDEMPQDFDTRAEAEEYAAEWLACDYDIECTD